MDHDELIKTATAVRNFAVTGHEAELVSLRAELARLRAELDTAKSEYLSSQQALIDAQKILRTSQAEGQRILDENRRLREALEKYASPYNWGVGQARTLDMRGDIHKRDVWTGSATGPEIAQAALKGGRE